jgi:dTDP-4-dehydrorhamnose reductase
LGLKLLLTENTSSLAKAIARVLEDYPHTLIYPPENLDWSDAEAVQRLIEKQHPALLINTLALDTPDHAAAAQYSEHLAQACGQRVAGLHLSSYRVFGTQYCNAGAYDEGEIPAPDDELGQHLRRAEQAFLALKKGVVLRLPWLAEPRGDNVFTRVASRLTSGKALEVSDVYRGCPTTVDDVARVVLAMVLQILCGARNWGVFHLHSSDSCSEAELADHIARLLEAEGFACNEIEILRNPENRLLPGCGLLAGTRCTNNFGIQLRSWRHDLKSVAKSWAKERAREGLKEAAKVEKRESH